MRHNELVGRVVVLSPHLDDGALSLGAGLAHAAGKGVDVTVLTVLANDPERAGPPSPFDAGCGFSTAQEAALARRDEDRRACEELGVRPVWLPFGDMEYGLGASDGEVSDAIAEACRDADALLVPGFPLAQPDHAWLNRLVLASPPRAARIGLYVEQPYAALQLIGRGRRTWSGSLTPAAGALNLLRIALRTPAGRKSVIPAPNVLPGVDLEAWRPLPQARAARRAKARAVRSYTSQLSAFGPLVFQRMALYERAAGGELITWVTSAGDATR